MLEDRARTREIDAYGGLWGKVPCLSFFFVLFAMASAGLPGLNNFISEFLVLTGSFGIFPLGAALGAVGLILPLVYTVRLVQEVLFQEERRPLAMGDLNLREGLLLTALALGDIYLGLHPAPLLDMLKTPVALLIGSGP
jgi:NADH-quinone oxidoreductase subunit M